MLYFDAIYTAYILYHMNSVSVGDSFMNDLNHEAVQVVAQQYAGSISSPLTNICRDEDLTSHYIHLERNLSLEI